MLTLQKLIKDCPLSEFDTIPSDLKYFHMNLDLYDCFYEGVSLWTEKRYFLFFLSVGSIFEFILFELASMASIEIYRQAGLEHLLPKEEVFIKSRRQDNQNLSNIYSELENKDQGYIKKFYIKDHFWTELQCLKFVIKNYVDDTVYQALLNHLFKIKECRNSFTHGNIQGFYKKLYPEYSQQYWSMRLPNDEEGFDPTKTKNVVQEIYKQPNQMILMHMLGKDKKTLIPYINHDFRCAYIQTAHILDFVSQKLYSLNDEIKSILPARVTRK